MYYIVSKKDNLGTSHTQSLHNYFELGWEVTTTHFDAKYLLASGHIDPEKDVVVTLGGREFLYSKLMKVMPWESYAAQFEIKDARKAAVNGAVDLTNFYASTASPDTRIYHFGKEKRYQHEHIIRPYIVAMDTPPVTQLAQHPFALCCWRYRNNHVVTRNTSPEIGQTVTDHLKKKFGRVYIVGLESERFCDGTRAVHVDLPTFAALCLNDNCKVVAGAMTGTMQLAAVLCKCLLAVYQHNSKEPCNESNHPCVMGECVNIFRNKRFVSYAPETSLPEYLKKLDEHLCIKTR